MAFRWIKQGSRMHWRLGDTIGQDGFVDVNYNPKDGWTLWTRSLTDFDYGKLAVPCDGDHPTPAECKVEGERIMRERMIAREAREKAARERERRERGMMGDALKAGVAVFGNYTESPEREREPLRKPVR